MKLAVCYYVPIWLILLLKYILTLWLIYNKPSIKCFWFFYSWERLGFTTEKGRVFFLFIFFLMQLTNKVIKPKGENLFGYTSNENQVPSLPRPSIEPITNLYRYVLCHGRGFIKVIKKMNLIIIWHLSRYFRLHSWLYCKFIEAFIMIDYLSIHIFY